MTFFDLIISDNQLIRSTLDQEDLLETTQNILSSQTFSKLCCRRSLFYFLKGVVAAYFFSEKKTFSIQLLFPAPFVACHDSTVVEKNNFLAIIKKIFCYKVFFSAKARKSIFDVIKNNKAFVFHRMIRQFFGPIFNRAVWS